MRAHLLIAAGCGLLTAGPAYAQTQAPPRGADRAPEIIRPLLGAWDLEIPDQPRKCTITLGVEEAPGGRQLRFPATCRRALPILDGAASWTISHQGVPRVLDGSGKVLISFESAGNDPGFSGKGSDGKAYRLDPQNYPRSARRPTPSRPEVAATAAQRPTVVDPATAPRAETLPGLYALMRQVNREACRLVLTPRPDWIGHRHLRRALPGYRARYFRSRRLALWRRPTHPRRAQGTYSRTGSRERHLAEGPGAGRTADDAQARALTRHKSSGGGVYGAFANFRCTSGAGVDGSLGSGRAAYPWAFAKEYAMFNAKSLLDALVKAGSQAGAQGGQAGGLGGVMGGLAQHVQKSGGVGGLAGMAGQILTQATQGVGDAARQTGVQQKAGDTFNQAAGGRTPQQILEQAKGMMASNPGMATAVLGGLGALVFGTSAGRSVAGSAAKLGGLALIGGLAYKAYQNHQAGKPLLDLQQQEVLPAPAGTGFEAEAASEQTALVFIRAMIAAAAADGSIDEEERGAILGGLREAGFDPEANEWLSNEMANPASVDALVEAAQTPELAAQIYTAARIAINPDTPAEKDFLAGLAGSLGLDAALVANIDAAASAAKV